MATYVIGDIHGRLVTFISMLDKLKLDKERDTLYLLGDYTDSGPDGIGVIQHIMNMQDQGFKVHCLMGNHDKMMLDVIDYQGDSDEEYQDKVVKAGFTGKSHGVRQSKDKWILKLECGCGSGFQRYKWRTNASTGEEIGGYACRHRVIDGSTEFRKSKGMPIDDTCSLPSIPEWKLDYMALEIFKKIWGNQADTIFEVYRLISQNYHIEQVKTRESPEYLEKQIQKCQSRLVALVDLYTDGDISLEVYRSKRDEYTSRMETLKAQLKEITANSGDTQEELIKERLIAIKQLLDDMALCNKEKSPNELINNFVDKIVVRSQTEFEWYININGNAEKYIAENCPKIHNEPYRDRAEKTKKLRDSSYYNIFRLHIGFDEVRAFKKRFGKFIRQSQWKDTDVVVYMR